ncbi:MAG: hypothetical protein ACP5KJ_02995 [Candidatus Micrarchaeia archaeon]
MATGAIEVAERHSGALNKSVISRFSKPFMRAKDRGEANELPLVNIKPYIDKKISFNEALQMSGTAVFFDSPFRSEELDELLMASSIAAKSRDGLRQVSLSPIFCPIGEWKTYLEQVKKDSAIDVDKYFFIKDGNLKLTDTTIEYLARVISRYEQ